MDNENFRSGVLCAFFSYLIWGLLALYWRLLSDLSPMHILGIRMIFSLLTASIVLFAQKKTAWLKFYRDRKKCIRLVFSSIFVCVSWGLFVWGVNNGYTVETALGYYINPLISIVLGICFFGERLKFLQAVAFSFAVIGVIILTIFTGSLPWISIGLALNFSFYGFLKKKIDMPALESVAAETVVAFPLAFLLLFTSLGPLIDGGNSGTLDISFIAGLSPHIIVALFFSGAVTILPLYLFSRGAKILPLSTLGFIQFISPTMTFLTGVFIFGEPFPPRNFIVFGFIWTAAVLYIISLKINRKKNTEHD